MEEITPKEKFSIFTNKEREARRARELWRKEYIWKPLWQLFVVCCIIYTILHVLKIGPLPDGY